MTACGCGWWALFMLNRIGLARVKVPNADPKPKADLLEVTARFVTTNKTL